MLYEVITDYIATRPLVEKISSHGLFTAGNDEIVLSQVISEIANHDGNVWLPIIALKAEDAKRSGFDNLESWKLMLEQYVITSYSIHYTKLYDRACSFQT